MSVRSQWKIVRKLLTVALALGVGILSAYAQDPSRYYDIALQGDTLIFQLEPQDCGGALTIFDHFYYCTPDHKVIIGVDMKQKMGTYGLTRRVEPGLAPTVLVRQILVQERPFPETTIRPPRYRPSPHRDREVADIAFALSQGEQKYPMNHIKNGAVTPLSSMAITDAFGTKRTYTIAARKDKATEHKKIVADQHRGVDLKADTGTPVNAVAHGIVMCAAKFSLEGNMIILYHGDGVHSLYMHLKEFRVLEGQYVDAGQLIALSDNTGASTGPHLHFAVKINGANVDPLRFLYQFGAPIDLDTLRLPLPKK